MLARLIAPYAGWVLAVVIAVAGYGYHVSSVHHLTKKHEKALTDARADEQAQCAADKKITQEVSHGYQTRIASLADQLARAKRMRNNQCVMLSPHSAGGRDATTNAREPARPHAGVTADALLEFAADAERYRLQLMSCQQFIRTAIK